MLPSKKHYRPAGFGLAHTNKSIPHAPDFRTNLPFLQTEKSKRTRIRHIIAVRKKIPLFVSSERSPFWTPPTSFCDTSFDVVLLLKTDPTLVNQPDLLSEFVSCQRAINGPTLKI